MEHDDSRPLSRRPTAPEPAMLTGVFRDTATSPTDELRVICDYHGERETFGPVVWEPHPGPHYPVAGDRAFIVQSRSAGLSVWVVVLWGAYNGVVPTGGGGGSAGFVSTAKWEVE